MAMRCDNVGECACHSINFTTIFLVSMEFKCKYDTAPNILHNLLFSLERNTSILRGKQLQGKTVVWEITDCLNDHRNYNNLLGHLQVSFLLESPPQCIERTPCNINQMRETVTPEIKSAVRLHCTLENHARVSVNIYVCIGYDGF